MPSPWQTFSSTVQGKMQLAPLTAEEYNQKARLSPDWFLKEAMGEQAWTRQIEIIESIRDCRRTAVKGCVASTKTRCAAQATYWFLNSYYPAKVIHIAPT